MANVSNRWVINYDCGYCGCDETHYIEFDEPITEAEAMAYADERLDDYIESTLPSALGWDGEYTEDEEDEFREGCYATILAPEDVDEDELANAEWESF